MKNVLKGLRVLLFGLIFCMVAIPGIAFSNDCEGENCTINISPLYDNTDNTDSNSCIGGIGCTINIHSNSCIGGIGCTINIPNPNNTDKTELDQAIITNIGNAVVTSFLYNLPGYDPSKVRIVATLFTPAIDTAFPKTSDKLTSSLIDWTVGTTVKLLKQNNLNPDNWGLKDTFVFAEEGVVTPTIVFFVLEKVVPTAANALHQNELINSNLYKFVLKPTAVATLRTFDHNLRVLMQGGEIDNPNRVYKKIHDFNLDVIINIGWECLKHKDECVEFTKETVSWCFQSFQHFGACAGASAGIYAVLHNIL